MTRTSRQPAQDYDLHGSFTRRALGLLAHALRTEPVRFGVAIAAAACFSLLTVWFGTLLGQITDNVVIPGIAGNPITGFWGDQTQDPKTAILLAGAVFLGIGVLNAILVGVRRAMQGGASQASVRVTARSLPMRWRLCRSAGTEPTPPAGCYPRCPPTQRLPPTRFTRSPLRSVRS